MEKSARFRVERCFNSYPLDYRAAFAFSPVLYPQAGAYGLTTFRMNDRIGLGPLCSPAAYPYRVVSMTGDAAAPVPAALPFLVAARKHLGPFAANDDYREFTYVGHAVHASPLPPDAGSETGSSQFRPSLRTGYVVRVLLTGHYFAAITRSVRVMEHPVMSSAD